MGKTLPFTEKDLSIIENTELSENLTDLGSCKRFIRQADGNLRFQWEMGKWLYFNGKFWETDKSGKIASELAENTIREMYLEAYECEDKKDREQIADYARKSESEAKIRAMLRLAQPQTAINLDELDPDGWLLNVENGTIDLRTGDLLPHNREHLISKIAPVYYVPDAKCPNWIEFLKMIMDGDDDMLTFLQRAIGYTLTGHTDERCLFILHGEGRNGKSTFTENLAYLMGDYASKTQAESLLLKKFGDGIPSDIARLKGARFVFASETAQGRRLNEARVKELTGDRDTITARFLHREWFEFIPNFKLWLHTNHRPTIRGAENAIWDRVRLIPFEVRIPDKKVLPRREVDEILEAERNGILTWAVKGCLDWQENGLPNPDKVTKANQEYREESDLIKDFLDEVCMIEPSAEVAKNDLFEAYLEWSKASGEKFFLNKTKFGAAMLQKGFDEYRETTGKRKSFWIGLKLNG